MGTSYYELEKPITHVSVKKLSVAHSDVNIWINHAAAGTLLARNDELRDLLIAFSSEKEIFHTHFGGKERGAVTQKMNDTGDFVVISEYGEIVSVRSLQN